MGSACTKKDMMKQKTHNKNLPSELQSFYKSKNQEIRRAHEEFERMQGSPHPSGMREHIQLNEKLFNSAMRDFEKRKKRIEIEWMEPNLVRAIYPKLSMKRERAYLDFRYDYWFLNESTL